jgi:hypothetical protein
MALWGHFLPVAAMVVTPVVCFAKATEKCNKNTKISCLQAIFVLLLFCKTY